MLQIHRYVIHELDKKAKTVITDLKLSEAIAEIDEFSESLILKLHESFKEDSSTKYSKFEENDSNVFRNGILNYVKSDFDETLFLPFTKDSMKDLESDLKKESLSAGGLFVYADYTFLNTRYILVTLVRKTDGFDTEIVNNVIRVKSIKNLNVNKLAMGFRLNLDIYLNKNLDIRQYIAIISNSKDVSEYFKNWIAAHGVINSETNTNSFIKIIKGIDKPDNFTTKQNFWQSIYEFVTVGKTIKLKLIGEHFFSNELALITYAEKENIIIDNEFTFSSTAIKALIEIKVNIDGIHLIIKRDKIDTNDIDIETGNVTLHSFEFATRLLKEINLQ